MRVLGVDVLSGSVNSKSLPRYSAVLLEDGEVAIREELGYRKLVSFISMVKPDFLGTDNIFELFTKKKVRNFFLRLPDKTKVLQVNGGPEKQEPLHVVARRYGISLTSKASSMEEAEACARLASLGVGHLVELFEDRTKIVVSRARSMGKGGQSKDRYRRKVHHLIALNVKIIEQELREQGIEYSLKKKKADYGLERGEFLVKARRSQLRGIKNTRGPDVQIKVKPVEKRKLSYSALMEKEEVVILGVDPGTTTSIAAVDLEGSVLEVISQKEFSMEKALLYAQKFEKTCLVATDVAPPPKFCSKLASKLNAPLFVPSSSLSVEEKRKLVEAENQAFSNPHERDSLAAAIKAYRSNVSKIEQLKRRLQERYLGNLFNEAVVRVMGGESLEDAIEELQMQGKPAGGEKKEREKAKGGQSAAIKGLREEVRQLKTVIEELDRENMDKEKLIARLKHKISYLSTEEGYKARKEREMRSRDSKIDYLSGKLNREKELRKKVQKKLNEARRANLLEGRKDLSLIRVAEKFNQEEVSKLFSLNLKEGELVLFKDSSGAGKSAAEKLLELRPRAVLAEKEKMSHLAREVLWKTPIISPSDLELNFVDSFALADKEELEKLLSREEEKIKLASAKREKERLESVIDRYREERELSLGT